MTTNSDGCGASRDETRAAEILELECPAPDRYTQDPVILQKMHGSLREQLMAAIRAQSLVEITMLVRKGVSLLPHYYSSRLATAKPGTPLEGTSKGPKSGLVNPVDWAALEHCFTAAMHILELADGKVVSGRDEHASFMTKLELARDTKQAVCIAAFRGQVRFLQMLLERSAPVGQKNWCGESALHLAVREGKADAAALLLRHGAWEAEDRKSDVLERAECRRLACVLEEAGALARGREGPPVGRPPWEQAVLELGGACGELEKSFKLKQIMERANPPSQKRPPPRPGVHQDVVLCKTSHDEPIKTWGDAMAECSVLQAEFREAIRHGLVQQALSLVRFQGVPLNTSFDLGLGDSGNCIDWAVVSEQPDIALALLEEADRQGVGRLLASETCAGLFWSVLRGYSELLRALLQRGADPGLRGRDAGQFSDSLLFLAVSSWRAEEAAELLRHGAWERELPKRQCELLGLAKLRGALVAEAFAAAGHPVESEP